MKTLIQYVGYFMAIIGAVTVIWRVAISFQKHEDKTAISNEKLDQVIVNLDSNTSLIDSLFVQYNLIRKGLNDLRIASKALRDSYIRYLQNDKSLSKEDFIKYMNGIEWFVLPVDSSDFKISIKKLK